jgi:Protein of unknown function (DUF3047)
MRSPLLYPALLATLLLTACATAPDGAANGGSSEWSDMHLPGKRPTLYSWTQKDGRSALQADSQSSASMWRRRLDPAPVAVGPVSFSWWVQDLVPGASVADVDREDAPARVIFGFEGDRRQLSARTRAMFELAHALTGEAPPYATLMYVWDSKLPVGSVVINPRSDRIRKIVVDSGPAGLRSWRDHRRDLAADFRLAFGEEPGALSSVAVMTDSDNTRTQSRTWYGSVQWQPAGPCATTATTAATATTGQC